MDPGRPAVPPGWYADSTAPSDQPALRWWDGERWTEHTAPWRPAAPVGPTRAGLVPMTPDGVPLAGWGQRVLAYLIDGLVVIVPVLVLAFPFERALAHRFVDYFNETVDATNNGTQPPGQLDLYGRILGPLIGFSAVSLIVLLTYQTVMLKTRSATLGKLAMGLRVRLRDTPGPLTWSTIGRRLLGQFGVQLIGWIPLVGSLIGLYGLLDVLWPLWDDKRQTLHDKLAGTNVVQHRP